MSLLANVPRTMLHALRENADRLGDKPALWTRRAGRYSPTSWRDYHRRVRQFAFGLSALGFRQGSALAILSFNREEWLIADLAAMGLGGVAVGLYTTSSPEQIQYVVGHCEAEIAVVEHQGYLATLQRLRPGLPRLRHVIVLEGPGDPANGVLTYEEVMRRGEGLDARDWDRAVDRLASEALATLIYTSGTTGNPKGVMLSHRNICWTAAHLSHAADIGPDDVMVSYLPLSHIAEQMCSIYGPVLRGIQIYFAESLERIADAIREVRPTVFFGVPRVWEKFKAKAEEGIRGQSVRKQQLISWARRATWERNARLMRGERPSAASELQYQAARRLVFEKLKEKIGFDRTRVFATSAAPIGRDVLDFFCSLDMVLREVYGQSEVTGPTSVNTLQNTHLGTVGRPMIGVEVRIAEDGEILVKGENVCLGYYKEPAATAELLEGGWLHSGDVGELDAEGYLRITGRKKEIIVTSGGKKTAPTNIEAMLKAIPPLGNAIVIGEARNFLVALLPLDPEKVPAFARERGWPEELAALTEHAEFRNYLDERIQEEVNQHLSRFENIRRYAVLPHDFTTEGGELTPTLKVRRKVVEQKYRELIEALYAQSPTQVAG